MSNPSNEERTAGPSRTPWSRGERIAVAGFVVTVLGVLAPLVTRGSGGVNPGTTIDPGTTVVSSTVDPTTPTSSTPSTTTMPSTTVPDSEGGDNEPKPPTLLLAGALSDGAKGVVGSSIKISRTFRTDSDGNASVEAGPTRVCDVKGSVIKFVGVGECTLTVNVSGTEKFLEWKKSFAFAVLKPGTARLRAKEHIGTWEKTTLASVLEIKHDSLEKLSVNVDADSDNVCAYGNKEFSFRESGLCAFSVVVPRSKVYSGISSRIEFQVVNRTVTSLQVGPPNTSTTQSGYVTSMRDANQASRFPPVSRPAGDWKQTWRMRVRVTMKLGSNCNTLRVAYARGNPWVQTDSTVSGDAKDCRSFAPNTPTEECLPFRPMEWGSKAPASLPLDDFEMFTHYVGWSVSWNLNSSDEPANVQPTVEFLELSPGKCPS